MIPGLFRTLIVMVCILPGICFQGFCQTCDTSLLELRQVRASDTDPNISFELYKHYVYYNPDCTPQNKLMIYMVGTWGNPVVNQVFQSLAANHGFHVISLKYPNNIYASQVCATDTNPDCYKNYRHEALYGEDVHDSLSIDSTNSIYNRASKLLSYLSLAYPTENWGQYLNGTDIIWTNVLPAGHSQGSGHAAFMGHEFNVHRVLMFAGPNEHSTYFNAPAGWLSEAKASPDSNFYVFNNSNDEIASFTNQLLGMTDMGLPAFGDTINIDNNICPFGNRRMLYTSRLFTGGISVNHGSVVADSLTPYDSNGIPEFKPVWEYMLGVCASVTSIDEYISSSSVEVFPNPFFESITLRYGNPAREPMVLKIYDKLGREVLKFINITNSQITIDTEHLQPGMYFYSLRNSEYHEMAVGKFVKGK